MRIQLQQKMSASQISATAMPALRVIALGFFILLINACSQSTSNDMGTTLDQAKHTGTAELTVLYVEADGFAYHDKDGELTGVTIEIMRDFVRWFERYHAVSIELNFVPESNWQTFYQRVVEADGGVFGLGNVTITAERRQELQFSPAYLNNVAVLITHEDVSELTSWNNLTAILEPLQPVAFTGTLHEIRVANIRDQAHPTRNITPATSNPEIIEAVAYSDAYSYIDAYNYWRALENGIPLRHHPIADESNETFGIIMPHSNDWAIMLTAFFAAEGGYRNTQHYRELLETHLGRELTEILEAARTGG